MVLPTWVLDAIRALPEEFTGAVRINAFAGGVTNINVEQSIKAKEPRTPIIK